MKYTLQILAVVLCMGCATNRHSVTPPLSDALQEKQYAVILSMDGFHLDLANRGHTPTLDSLRRAGSYSELYPVFPANTFPSHYSMATGLHPDRHGVVNNTFYDKKAQQYRSVFNKKDVRTEGFWGGEPIWNTAEKQGLTTHIYMWPGSDVPIDGRQASIWTAYTSEPSYYERADWVLSAMTRPETEIPDLVMWYFDQPDGAMHRHGPTSREAVAQAEHIDSVLRYFFYHIRKSPVFERINFIVTADHGMTQLSEERRINLYELLDTTQVVRTVRETPFGLEVKPSYAQKAIRILRRTGHIKAWKREKMPNRYHYGSYADRLTNLIVLPEMGWRLDYTPCPRPLSKQGAHGYDNFDRDMQMVFYGSGPAFRKDFEQKSFQNNNIYLILCHLLRIEPAPNDGNWQQVRKMFQDSTP